MSANPTILLRRVDDGVVTTAAWPLSAIHAALSAAGWVVVPREPTPGMILAAPGRDQQATEESMYHGIYRAMIAAALPTPPQEATEAARGAA